MNSIFKELWDNGRIEKTPVFECDGRKVYQFSNDGAGMSQRRFEALGDVMQAYSAFMLDPEDVDTYLEIIESNTRRAVMDYKHDAESAVKLLEENQRLTTELKIRREYGVPLNRSFDFMSFIAIEEDENPLIYDEKYNKEKIMRWRKHLDIEKKMPFLKMQLPIFPNTSRLLESDSLSFIRNLNLQNAASLRITAKQLNLNGQENEIQHSLGSRVATLSEYDTYLTELSRNITDIQPNGIEESEKKLKVIK